MATTPLLSNATCTISGGGLVGSVDVSDQLQALSVTSAVDELEITSLADTAHEFTGGLEMNEVSMTLYNSYGSGEVEATLSSIRGKGNIVLTMTGTTSTSEGPSNPKFVLTNCFLASTNPIQSQYGELQIVEVTFRGGVLTRDITP